MLAGASLSFCDLGTYNCYLITGYIALRKQIITIAGKPGSGKSVTAKGVAKELGFKHFSSGDLFRAIGKELGTDVLRTNRAAETNAEIDQRVDGRLQEIGQTEDRLVVDSRMAWHWMPESYRVFLDLDLETAASRVLADMTDERIASENIPRDLSEYAKILQERLDSESRRYMSKYGADAYDKSQFDLVVDTAANGIEQVIDIVVQGYREWQKAGQ